MGRQAYSTRLALGRSAFEPLTPEADSIIAHTNGPGICISPRSCSPSSSPETSMYVQQYDTQGYPENATSKRLTRQSRRAMNDVLATVGVCVVVNADDQPKAIPKKDLQHPIIDKPKVKAIMQENEVGYLLSSADLGLFFFSQLWTTGLRKRLQVGS